MELTIPIPSAPESMRAWAEAGYSAAESGELRRWYTAMVNRHNPRRCAAVAFRSARFWTRSRRDYRGYAAEHLRHATAYRKQALPLP